MADPVMRPGPHLDPRHLSQAGARRVSLQASRRAAHSVPALELAWGATSGAMPRAVAAPTATPVAAAYDAFAALYERYWSTGLSAQLWAAAEPLVRPHLPPGAHVLDLCCGTGVASAALLAHGYRVTGVDASAGMLAHARRRAPGARFVTGDLRYIALERDSNSDACCDGAVCLGEGLNHLLTPGDLAQALARVAAALRPGAPFVFDVVEERRFVAHWWGQVYETREADHAFAACGTYDPATRLARMRLEIGWRAAPATEGWQYAERVLDQRCHTPSELDAALRQAGFTAASHDAARDLGLADQADRTFVVARRTGRG